MTDIRTRAREIAALWSVKLPVPGDVHGATMKLSPSDDVIAKIEAALLSARQEGLEEALCVARDIDFPAAGMGDVSADFIEGWNSACGHIATAIRQLKDKG